MVYLYNVSKKKSLVITDYSLLVTGELKQGTFLTQHGRHEEEKQNCDWLQMLYLFPVNVRVVKNVTCLSSLI